MRVLHVLDYSPSFAGGFHELLLALGDGMHGRGHHVTFAFPQRQAWFADISRSADALEMPEIRRPVRSGFRRAAERVCDAEHVDLVHLHFSFALPLALACARRRWPLPVVYHWHNPPKALMPSDAPDARPAGRPLASVLARFTDARAITRHVTVSREIRDLLVAHRWSSPAKVTCLPNAIPTQRRHSQRERERERERDAGGDPCGLRGKLPPAKGSHHAPSQLSARRAGVS